MSLVHARTNPVTEIAYNDSKGLQKEKPYKACRNTGQDNDNTQQYR